MCMCRKRKSSNQTCCLTPENPSTMAVRIETSVPPLWGTRTMASTCSFVPCADHPELFQALYQRYRTFQARLMLFRFIFSSFLVARTNRTRGSKILRCFPHCCPGHMGRSFCGSSLRLRVDTQVPSELLVFARFRLAKAREFAVGDCISASDVLASLQSEQNPNGEWITAHEHVELAQRHSRCFLLNPSARWFYSWKSGVAKSHRLQEHILSILVVAPIRASTQEGNPMWLRVVATTASPPFKLISFRRATAAAITAIEEMPSPVGQAKMSAAPAQLTKPADMAGESTLRGVLLPSLPAMTRQARTQELVFLFSAVEQIQARDILGCADKIFKIYDATLDFQTNMSLTGSSCLRKWLELLVLTGNEERCRHEAWTSSSLVVTLSLVAAWCSFDVEFNRTVHQFVRVGSKQVLNRDALHAVFEELVSWVWVKLDEYLRCLNWSLPALLQKLIVIFPATSIGSHESAFHSYPAQVREGVVDQNVRLDRHPGSFGQPNNTKNSSFSGIWTMGLQDVHLRRLEPSYDGSAGVQPLTLTTLLAFQRQLATISTSFSPSNQHFSLVSLLFAEKGTQLRLDMRDRWFRRFPAGESTHALSISGYSFGDYVGSYASHQRELHWNLYAWPKDADSHTALCFQFQVKASRDERTLCVVVRVSQGAIDTTARRLVVLSTLSLREKLCLVPHWTPKHVVDWVYHRGSSVY